LSVDSFILSYTPKSMRCDSQASLLAHTLASPCLGHEPKAKVATIKGDREGIYIRNKIYLTMFIQQVSVF
jgi:hypothetical protein